MRTYILMWNPEISSYTKERFNDDLIELNEDEFAEGVGNWSIWEHENAQKGDRFFMVRVGNGNTGIVMAGYFCSDPYQDEDWSGRNRPTYYMDIEICCQINSDAMPIITTERLMKELPGFDWTRGHSGRLLDDNLAAKLEEMWRTYSEDLKSLYEPVNLYFNEYKNLADYPTRVRFNKKCSGKESFSYGGEKLEEPATITDFWRYQYSNIWNLTSDLSEYIVAHALGIQSPVNRGYWALWDIRYMNHVRIEVKATADFHCWTQSGDKPTPRVFGINQAHSRYKDTTSLKCRQSDIIVFCHNRGRSAEEIYPLDVKNWDFYILSTDDIDKHCNNQKTISLNRVRTLTKGKSYNYKEIKNAIDEMIPHLKLKEEGK